jgi:hypothetical protein
MQGDVACADRATSCSYINSKLFSHNGGWSHKLLDPEAVARGSRRRTRPKPVQRWAHRYFGAYGRRLRGTGSIGGLRNRSVLIKSPSLCEVGAVNSATPGEKTCANKAQWHP